MLHVPGAQTARQRRTAAKMGAGRLETDNQKEPRAANRAAATAKKRATSGHFPCPWDKDSWTQLIEI